MLETDQVIADIKDIVVPEKRCFAFTDGAMGGNTPGYGQNSANTPQLVGAAGGTGSAMPCARVVFGYHNEQLNSKSKDGSAYIMGKRERSLFGFGNAPPMIHKISNYPRRI